MMSLVCYEVIHAMYEAKMSRHMHDILFFLCELQVLALCGREQSNAIIK